MDGWWLTLVDRDYPSVTVLHRVDPHVVVPTGVTVDLCDLCRHEAGRRPNHSNLNLCDAHPTCACMLHPARD